MPILRNAYVLSARKIAPRRRVAAAVSELRRARAALRSEIVAAIETTARSLAGERGLGRVYESNAPANATDITAAVVERTNADM